MSDEAALQALPKLRDVIAAHKLSARKALGQNFLLDVNLTRRIARAAGPLGGVHVVEVGPGPGGLTRALLLEGACRVTVIERDRQMVPALEEIARAAPGRLVIREADARACNLNALDDGAMPLKVIANLPYNIATQLLVNWLSVPDWPARWESLTLMFQKEVAERIVAAPGTGAYGRLSVLCGWRCRAQTVLSLPPRAFTPPPKVASTLVHLEPRPEADTVSPAAISAVTAAAFGQRRKMLRSSLKTLWRDPEPALAAAGIDPTLRAERVPVAGYLALARHLLEFGQAPS